mmetsp:Transcript_24330/g.63920  ORF Transcript_24330/g.63920 Transcript_24330/m.63920 type:complete len:224 (-) Transcript_24330:450-1121(-)
MCTHFASVFLQLFIIQNIQNSKACSAADWVPSEGVEVLQTVVEGLGHTSGRHYSSQGHAVPERLAHRHNVRDHFLLFKGPEAVTETSKSDLHLVRDAHPSRGPHSFVRFPQIPSRWDNHTSDGHTRLRDECCHCASFCTGGSHILRVARPRVGVTMLTSVDIRTWDLVDAGLRSFASSVIELVWADVDRLLRVPVVPMVHHDDGTALGTRKRQSHSEIVGLRA